MKTSGLVREILHAGFWLCGVLNVGPLATELTHHLNFTQLAERIAKCNVGSIS
jgi:hypothetical protein